MLDQVQNPVFAMPDKVQLLSGRCLVSRTTRYSSYRLHKVWRVIVQGGKTSRGPCTPWGLEAGFMDKVPGIKFHLVQFCRVGGKSWHAVAFCCQRGQIQTQVFALSELPHPRCGSFLQLLFGLYPRCLKHLHHSGQGGEGHELGGVKKSIFYYICRLTRH